MPHTDLNRNSYKYSSDPLFPTKVTAVADATPLAEDLKLCESLGYCVVMGGWCVLQEVNGPIEDMFMWVDKRGGYHTLFHLMYGCENCGSHAYSVRARHDLSEDSTPFTPHVLEC